MRINALKNVDIKKTDRTARALRVRTNVRAGIDYLIDTYDAGIYARSAYIAKYRG